MNRCKKPILRTEGFYEVDLEHKKQAAALMSKQGNRTVVLFHKGFVRLYFLAWREAT
jgi:hypothetical protein